MDGSVEIHVRAFNDQGEEVEARVTVPAPESDLRLAAFAAVQESGPKLGKELGISPAEQMQVMMARIGALSRDMSERV